MAKLAESWTSLSRKGDLWRNSNGSGVTCGVLGGVQVLSRKEPAVFFNGGERGLTGIRFSSVSAVRVLWSDYGDRFWFSASRCFLP